MPKKTTKTIPSLRLDLSFNLKEFASDAEFTVTKDGEEITIERPGFVATFPAFYVSVLRVALKKKGRKQFPMEFRPYLKALRKALKPYDALVKDETEVVAQ